MPGADRRVVASAIAANMSLNVVLRVAGAKRAYRVATWVGIHTGAPSHGPDDDRVADARHVGGLVNHVSSVFPARARCLVRSLTLRTLLLRRGTESDLQLGARRSPSGLTAHAWLDVDGQTINDAPDTSIEFVPFSVDRRHWAA